MKTAAVLFPPNVLLHIMLKATPHGIARTPTMSPQTLLTSSLFICIWLTHDIYMDLGTEKDQGKGSHWLKDSDRLKRKKKEKKKEKQLINKNIFVSDTNYHGVNSPDVVGWKKSQALFRKWLCIFRGNKCGIEGSRYTHRRLVHVSLSYSLATVETPQDRKIGSGTTACSKLRLPTSFQFVWTSFDLVEVIKFNFCVVKGDTENIEIKYASLETLISYLFCSTGSLETVT